MINAALVKCAIYNLPDQSNIKKTTLWCIRKYFYGSATNHLELGIWVGRLVACLVGFKTNFNAKLGTSRDVARRRTT